MSFLTKAATTALAGLAILGAASAAFAHHLPQQPFVREESALLINVLERTGHTLYSDGNICRQHGGGLMGVATTDRELVVCVSNHDGDDDEMADTLRHEAIHLAQMCKGRRNGTRISLLLPQHQAQVRHDAETHLHFTGAGYHPTQLATEAEARVLAHHWDEHDVANALLQECGLQ